MSAAAIWMPIALRELGVHETSGAASTARIIDYNTATTLQAVSDEIPWCSSFVNWTMRVAGLPRTRSAMARSWISYGKRTTVCYGAIAVLTRDLPPAGHVGFVIDADGELIWLLGGNQGNAVSIRAFALARVVDIRWPAD